MRKCERKFGSVRILLVGDCVYIYILTGQMYMNNRNLMHRVNASSSILKVDDTTL